MKKISFMVMSLLLAGMAFTACSSDDDMQVKENVVLDADTLQVFDGFDVKFQMLDAQGRPVTKFKEGENFTFKLAVINKQKETLPLVIILACHGTRLSKWEWQYISYTSRNRPQFHAGLSAKIVMNDLS